MYKVNKNKKTVINTIKYFSANRITTMHDFGYVALNMKYVNPEDSGTYTCRAVNELGEAVTSSTLFVQCTYIFNDKLIDIRFAFMSVRNNLLVIL